MSLGKTRYQGWEDMVELLLAIWIIGSPFFLGFFSVGSASATLMLIGTFIFLISQLGLSTQEPWEEWVNLALAAILLVSPWLFGFADHTVAMVNSVASAICVAIFALLSMLHEYSDIRTGKTV